LPHYFSSSSFRHQFSEFIGVRTDINDYLFRANCFSILAPKGILATTPQSHSPVSRVSQSS
jgi:hypothetical protein